MLEVDKKKGTVLFEGLDVVDGSPILDIKPYVPFCDSPPNPVAPDWVSDSNRKDDPLRMGEVVLTKAGMEQLGYAWRGARKKKSKVSAFA